MTRTHIHIFVLNECAGPYGRALPAKVDEGFDASRNDSNVKKPGTGTFLTEMLKGPVGVFVIGISVLAVVIQVSDKLFDGGGS
jgi:hypothetical protein